jgi:hypothetical protein
MSIPKFYSAINLRFPTGFLLGNGGADTYMLDPNDPMFWASIFEAERQFDKQQMGLGSGASRQQRELDCCWNPRPTGVSLIASKSRGGSALLIESGTDVYTQDELARHCHNKQFKCH